MSSEIHRNQRGLAKLMLRMPALRGPLQILSAKDADMFSLCGAFDEASATLDRLRKEDKAANAQMLTEYEGLCADIEREILEMCLK